MGYDYLFKKTNCIYYLKKNRLGRAVLDFTILKCVDLPSGRKTSWALKLSPQCPFHMILGHSPTHQCNPRHWKTYTQMQLIVLPNQRIFIFTSTCINGCEVFEVRVGVQIFRREIHTHIYT